MAAPSTTSEPRMLDWVSLKASTICFMQGTVASTMSSGRRTAKGSSPTSSLAMRTAWPRRRGWGWGLAGLGDLGELRDGAGNLEEGGFIFCGQGGFELWADVEVVFHGGFAAA